MPADLDQVLVSAMEHHRDGRFPQAEALYREVLAKRPDEQNALNSFAMLLHQQGRSQEALACLTAAAAAVPDQARTLTNLGLVQGTLGKMEEAEVCLRRALVLEPEFLPALSNLAELLMRRGRGEEALELFRRAVDMEPERAGLHYNLGNALAALNRLKEALEAYQAAHELDPKSWPILANLANVLGMSGRLAEAGEVLERALLLDPLNPALCHNLGGLKLRLGLAEEAEELFGRALAQSPGHPSALLGRGMARFRRGDAAGAEADYRAALQNRPDYPDVQVNLGHLLRHSGRMEEAEAVYGQVLEAHPDYSPARVSLAALALARGQYAPGWSQWEGRRTDRRYPQGPDLPGWEGGRLEGSLLLWPDCGLGESLLLLRALPLARELADAVLLSVPEGWHAFLSGVKGLDGLTAPGDNGGAAAACPLLSLGAVLGIFPEDLPREPYLTPDPAGTAMWRERLGGEGGLLVGLAWRGDESGPEAAFGEPGPADWALLAGVEGVRWVALCPGDPPPGLETLLAPQPPGRPEDLTALMAALDLVVTVDGTLAHMAGAAGLPGWVLLGRAPAWYWGLEGDRTLWHPGLRLFRRGEEGWSGVMSELMVELMELVSSRA